MTIPARGFPPEEFARRVHRAQTEMARADLGALLLTTEAEVRYYSGFLTRFWESPTRPWFLVLPAEGAPLAVIPAIGAALMAQTWIADIRTWPAPDYDDDGVGLLARTLREVTEAGTRIGLADGPESHARLPLQSLARLRRKLGERALVSDAGITARLRCIKSDAEIDKMRCAAQIANRAFARLDEIAAPGVALEALFRRFQILCLEEGADWVPYLAGASGRGGYADVISPATGAPLQDGDVVMLDTGLVRDGYFCDFDRNISLGAPPAYVAGAHARLVDAARAGAEAARPGATMADLYQAMAAVLTIDTPPGRLGHGVGLQLTEGPSILPQDETVLKPGMVLAIEPLVPMPDGRIMVHEENIVIRAGGPEYLSDPQPRAIRVVPCV